MDVLEDHENKIIWVTTVKRERRIKIFIPQFNRFPHWRIRYEDGTSINGLDGVYTTRAEALRAVGFWEHDAKESQKVYQDRVFGTEPPPVLKYKKVKKRGPRDNGKTS